MNSEQIDIINACEICAALCEDEFCTDCLDRMASHDSSDIWQRVQQFDNTAYEIDALKIAICEFYGITELFVTHHKQPEATARGLFYYMLRTLFNMRLVDICNMAEVKQHKVSHCNIIHHCKFWEYEIKRKQYKSLVDELNSIR